MNVLQCVVVCCSVLQCVAVCCRAVLQSYAVMSELCHTYERVAVCCRMLQCVAVRCSAVLQCVAVCCSVLQYITAAVCCSVLLLLQRVVVCCNVCAHENTSMYTHTHENRYIHTSTFIRCSLYGYTHSHTHALFPKQLQIGCFQSGQFFINSLKILYKFSSL